MQGMHICRIINDYLLIREIYDLTGYGITVPPPRHLERVALLLAGFDPRVSR